MILRRHEHRNRLGVLPQNQISPLIHKDWSLPRFNVPIKINKGCDIIIFTNTEKKLEFCYDVVTNIYVCVNGSN